jgi:hypothetical protein
MRDNNYHFGKPTEPTKTPDESPFKNFIVSCLKCKSFAVVAMLHYDEETGDESLILTCAKCKQVERLKL